ncbi:vanadium-dependent haloperoxidase [Actinokineospora iranica]|uniref:Membrane-associated phospholipid phosphatase n=1 Tax=Actinokineospora iranica TaxID=1271860 RepID=A0A1G6RZQ7_9PSEU|nr:vanadium-dependent haloperoxidase [Actinokineospora iranica]SDD09891.1 Membrane-associated phospholipid phosphatase [Actinokineospora iranica]
MEDRCSLVRASRLAAADAATRNPWPDHVNNGEEGDYPFVANFSKGLPHDDTGEVVPEAYNLLLRALTTGRAEDFERVPVGERKLVNPRAGLAFDLEGTDAQALLMPAAPRVDSARNSAEMVELYWMALCRDVPFTDFDTNPLAEQAAAELSRLSDYRAPKENGRVTPGLLFRGDTPGDRRGPYLSQFLLRDIQYGTLRIPQTHDTVRRNRDFLTKFDDWLAVQRGERVAPIQRDHVNRRFLRTPRDMANYVHFDALYEAYLNAALILLGLDAPVDNGNPYRHSANQEGFGTYGPPHVLTLVTEVATRALKAAWFQKWFVHRRPRPEAFGGRVHAHLTGLRDYDMIDIEVLDSTALKLVHERHGSFLLPQAFPEGSPMHPSYGSGHATVAGACVTVLKAWFDESWTLPRAVVPNTSGTALAPYEGADADKLTVGGELDKVAANIASARTMAGVHWRTDYSAAVRLGEAVAIGVLRDQVRVGHEDASFGLTRFDGTRMTI